MNLFPRLRTPLSFIASLIASHCAFQAVRAEDTNKSNLRSGVNFQLKTAVDLKVLGRSATHDLNLGESPALFVKALWKQLTGKLPDPDLVREYADKLGTPSFPRRIDLGISLAERQGFGPVGHIRTPGEPSWSLGPIQHGRYPAMSARYSCSSSRVQRGLMVGQDGQTITFPA